MRQFILGAALLLLVSPVAFGQDFLKFRGTQFDTTINNDSTFGQINKLNIYPRGRASVWKRLVGWVKVYDASDVLDGSGVSSIGEVDTGTIRIMVGEGLRIDTVFVLALSTGVDSSIFEFEFYPEKTVTDTMKDSAGVTEVNTLVEGNFISLAMQHLWMDYRLFEAEGDGAGDTLLYQLDWMFLLYKE